jgi:hypothetical protein
MFDFVPFFISPFVFTHSLSLSLSLSVPLKYALLFTTYVSIKVRVDLD